MLIRASAGVGETDSHAIIVRLRIEEPVAYAADQQRFSRCKDPVRAHYASLGRRLLRVPHLTKAQRVRSLNVRGNITTNQQWRR